MKKKKNIKLRPIEENEDFVASLCIEVSDRAILDILLPKDEYGSRGMSFTPDGMFREHESSNGSYMCKLAIVDKNQKRFYKLFNQAILKIVEAYNKKEDKDERDLKTIYALSNLMMSAAITVMACGEASFAERIADCDYSLCASIMTAKDESTDIDIYLIEA